MEGLRVLWHLTLAPAPSVVLSQQLNFQEVLSLQLKLPDRRIKKVVLLVVCLLNRDCKNYSETEAPHSWFQTTTYTHSHVLCCEKIQKRKKKINQREKKRKRGKKKKKKKKTRNEGERALRIQYIWQKKYPPEPENCHRVAVISVSNSFQLWIMRPISRAPRTQQPFTVTRQSSNSENKDHMSSSLQSSSLPVYAALARTARSLM